MKVFLSPVDLSAANTIIYHVPGGPTLSVQVDGIEEYIELGYEMGHICDNSEIDGTVHFFPRGNAWSCTSLSDGVEMTSSPASIDIST